MKFSLFVVAAVGLSPLSAFAHGKACHDDMKKHCADVKPGDGKVHACMKEHEAELSAGCKADVAAHKTEVQAWKEACTADRESLCKDVKPGAGRVAACMHDNEAKASAGCKTALQGNKKHWGEVQSACAADLKTHCKPAKTKGKGKDKGAQEGAEAKEGQGAHGTKMSCLEEHAAELSPACKGALDEIE